MKNARNSNTDYSIDPNQALLRKFDSKADADRVSIVDADVGFDLTLDKQEDSISTYSAQSEAIEIVLVPKHSGVIEGSELNTAHYKRLALYGKPTTVMLEASPFVDGDCWFELKNTDGHAINIDILAKRIRFKCFSATPTEIKFYAILGS